MRSTQEDRDFLDALDWFAALGRSALMFAALDFLDDTEREEMISGQGPDYAAIARVIESPDDLLQPDRLAAALVEQPFVVSTAAYFPAARILASESRAGAEAARRAYAAEARAGALPGAADARKLK